MHAILTRTRIVLTLLALLVILFVGRFMVAQAPTAHAAYVPPPSSCSWSNHAYYHYTTYTYGSVTYNFTEWIEIDGLYLGSTFCDVARVSVCRYGSHSWDGGLNTYYVLSNGNGAVAPTQSYLAVPAGSTYGTRCYSNWSSISMYSGESISVVAQWTDPGGGREPTWSAGRGF